MRAAQRIAGELRVDAQPLAGIAMMAREVRDASIGIAAAAITVISFQNKLPSLR